MRGDPGSAPGPQTAETRQLRATARAHGALLAFGKQERDRQRAALLTHESAPDPHPQYGLPAAVAATVQASENIAADDFVNIYDSAGSPRCRKADATDPAKMANGFALAAITSGNSGSIAFFGLCGATVAVSASMVYLSDTVPGGFTSTAPTTAGYLVQPLGPAIEGLGVAFTQQQGITL